MIHRIIDLVNQRLRGPQWQWQWHVSISGPSVKLHFRPVSEAHRNRFIPPQTLASLEWYSLNVTVWVRPNLISSNNLIIQFWLGQNMLAIWQTSPTLIGRPNLIGRSHLLEMTGRSDREPQGKKICTSLIGARAASIVCRARSWISWSIDWSNHGVFELRVAPGQRGGNWSKTYLYTHLSSFFLTLIRML